MTIPDPIQNTPQVDHPTEHVDQPGTASTLSSENTLTTAPTKNRFRYTKKQVWSLVPILLLLIVCMGVLVPSLQKPQELRGRAAVTGTVLSLAPAAKTAAIGETFSLGITMNTDTDTVSAAELHLSYDPTAIEILTFTPGTVLPVVLTPETHANGDISVTLGAQPTSPFKGAGIVGRWKIKIVAAKQSSIQFTNTTAVAAIGKTTNALASTTGSTITGTAPVTPTSTRAPTPTPACQPVPACAYKTPPCSYAVKGVTYCPKTPTPTPTPPPGCYYKLVQCFKEPCAPVLVCPTPTTVSSPTPRPTKTPTPTFTLTPTRTPIPTRTLTPTPTHIPDL